ADGTLGGGIAQGLGASLVPMFDEATNSMLSFQERMGLVSSDINNFVGGAIGGMIDGLAQMGAAWIATGEFSAKAALQMLSATAFSIASQAAIKSVFEAAEAAAAFARYDFYAGSMHVAAGSLYASVAVIAAGAGLAFGLGARALGGGSKKSSGGGSPSNRDSSASTQRPTNPDPYSRTSGNAFTSGRDRAIDELTSTIAGLNQKISGMKPGDVLVVGASQQRGFIGRTVVKEIGSNASIGVAINRTLGNK
ncbi:MAG: hypothetical protein ABI539_02375, partial [Acidobacteriota bacterium]